MRAHLFAGLALLFALTSAAPADAQADLGLRGAQPRPAPRDAASAAASSAGVSVDAPAPTVEPVPPPALPATAYEAGQCRASCDRTYYFCLASERVDDCPGAWGQCRAACDAAASGPPG